MQKAIRLLNPRFIGFVLGGGAIALLGFIILDGMVKLGFSEQVAFLFQLALTLLLNYLFNYYITYRSEAKDPVTKAWWRFVISRVPTLFLGWAIFTALTLLSMHYVLANGVSLVVTTVVNYITSSAYVFCLTDPNKRNVAYKKRIRPKFSISARTYKWVYGSLSALLVLNIWHYKFGSYSLPHVTLSIKGMFLVVVLAMSAANIGIGILETQWMTYGRRNPDALESLAFPPPVEVRKSKLRFDLIVPALHEETVLQGTIEQLARQTHPNVRIYVTLHDHDTGTIAAANAAVARYPERVTVLTNTYPPGSGKANQLNYALNFCGGDIVGVIDAEDDTQSDLLRHVEALFLETDADVVQGGVQLVNMGKWFCVHNVMEYFFWFSSRMFSQIAKGFVPLGGNTVFIRRDLLVLAGGWKDAHLTEDCELGVRLSTVYNAKVVAAYDPALATREETPLTVRALVHQRTRWCQGFLAVLLQSKWRKLPTMRQKAQAFYILAMPFIQAFGILMLPFSFGTAILLKAPVALALLSFTPFIPISINIVLREIGLFEFSRAYTVKVRLRDYVSLVVMSFVYQWILMIAAWYAVVRYMRKNNDWKKTGHFALHRPASTNYAYNRVLVGNE